MPPRLNPSQRFPYGMQTLCESRVMLLLHPLHPPSRLLHLSLLPNLLYPSPRLILCPSTNKILSTNFLLLWQSLTALLCHWLSPILVYTSDVTVTQRVVVHTCHPMQRSEIGDGAFPELTRRLRLGCTVIPHTLALGILVVDLPKMQGSSHMRPFPLYKLHRAP